MLTNDSGDQRDVVAAAGGGGTGNTAPVNLNYLHIIDWIIY